MEMKNGNSDFSIFKTDSDKFLASLYNVVKRNIDNGLIERWYISEEEMRNLKNAGDYLLKNGLILDKIH